MIPPLALGFSMSDRTSANSGAPVAFGAINIGGGSAQGGGSAPNTLDQSGSATATTIPTSIASNPMAGLIPGMGGTGGNPFGDILPAMVGGGFGLNGGQVQDPRAGALFAGLPSASDPAAVAAPAGGFPVIGIAAVGIAAIAAFFIVGR